MSDFMKAICEARRLSLAIDGTVPVGTYWELGREVQRLIDGAPSVTLVDGTEFVVKSVNGVSKATGIAQARCNRASLIFRSFDSAAQAVKAWKALDGVDFTEWTSDLATALNGKAKVREPKVVDKVAAELERIEWSLSSAECRKLAKLLAAKFLNVEL